MIIVTAPTSQIGSKVLNGLLAAGAEVRVVVRNPARLPDHVRGMSQIIEDSHGDAAVIERAFARADAVLWLVPPEASKPLDEVWLDFTRPAAEALRWDAASRVVSVTAIGRGRNGRTGRGPSPPHCAPTSY